MLDHARSLPAQTGSARQVGLGCPCISDGGTVRRRRLRRQWITRNRLSFPDGPLKRKKCATPARADAKPMPIATQNSPQKPLLHQRIDHELAGGAGHGTAPRNTPEIARRSNGSRITRGTTGSSMSPPDPFPKNDTEYSAARPHRLPGTPSRGSRARARRPWPPRWRCPEIRPMSIRDAGMRETITNPSVGNLDVAKGMSSFHRWIALHLLQLPRCDIEGPWHSTTPVMPCAPRHSSCPRSDGCVRRRLDPKPGPRGSGPESRCTGEPSAPTHTSP